jgi:hypothetical protein
MFRFCYHTGGCGLYIWSYATSDTWDKQVEPTLRAGINIHLTGRNTTKKCERNNANLATFDKQQIRYVIL